MARQLDVSALVGPIGTAQVQAQDGGRAPYGDALDAGGANWLPCQSCKAAKTLSLVNTSAKGTAKAILAKAVQNR